MFLIFAFDQGTKCYSSRISVPLILWGVEILVEIVIGRKYIHNMSILPYNEIIHVLIYKRVVTNQIIYRTYEAYELSEVWYFSGNNMMIVILAYYFCESYQSNEI